MNKMKFYHLLIILFYRTMLSLMFCQRRIIHDSFNRVRVLNKVSKINSSVGGVSISTSQPLKNKDDELKNDPYVKNILKEFQSDFKEEVKQEEPIIDNKDSETSAETPPNNSSSGKNISQLLSELYGTDGEKKETYSSIGNSNLREALTQQFASFCRWLQGVCGQ